jgi:hypothetical protein
MRLCLLRWPDERLLPWLQAHVRPRLGFSSNLRFLIVIINDYFVRSPLSSARNFSESPKKPTGRVYSTCGAMIFNIPLRGRKVLLMLKHKGVKCCPVGRALCIVRPGGPLRAAWCGSHHETCDAHPIYQRFSVLWAAALHGSSPWLCLARATLHLPCPPTPSTR